MNAQYDPHDAIWRLQGVQTLLFSLSADPDTPRHMESALILLRDTLREVEEMIPKEALGAD